jgi:hypothetical protein
MLNCHQQLRIFMGFEPKLQWFFHFSLMHSLKHLTNLSVQINLYLFWESSHQIATVSISLSLSDGQNADNSFFSHGKMC